MAFDQGNPDMSMAMNAEMAARKSAETFRLWRHLDPMIRWARRSIIIAGVLVVVFFTLETIRTYQTLAAIHPWVGVAALIGLGVAIALIVGPGWRFLSMPRVIEPPPLPADGKLTPSQCVTEIRFLERYLVNCERNPSFGSQRVAITTARAELALLLLEARDATPATLPNITTKLSGWANRCMMPVLHDVDEKADRLIYQEALSVGLATAASPNGVLDAFVMLWRGVRLVSEIGILYYGRPGIWGTLAICRDVSFAVAIAGYMQNVTNSLGNILAGTLGKAGGMVAGPAVDGITNALVLIRIGYLAKERCRSYRHWDAAAQKNAVLSAVSATQKVAFGLATEILRQVGYGVSAMASGIAQKLGEAGSTVMDTAETAAGAAGRAANTVVNAASQVADAAVAKAKYLRDRMNDMFKGDEDEERLY